MRTTAAASIHPTQCTGGKRLFKSFQQRQNSREDDCRVEKMRFGGGGFRHRIQLSTSYGKGSAAGQRRPDFPSSRSKNLRELSAVGDNDGLGCLAAAAADALNSLDDLHALGHVAEHNVLAVQPGGGDSAEEELRQGRGQRLSETLEICGVCSRREGGAEARLQPQEAAAEGAPGSRWCRGQRWPWTGRRGRCASAGSSRRQTWRRRWTCRRCRFRR